MHLLFYDYLNPAVSELVLAALNDELAPVPPMGLPLPNVPAADPDNLRLLLELVALFLGVVVLIAALVDIRRVLFALLLAVNGAPNPGIVMFQSLDKTICTSCTSKVRLDRCWASRRDCLTT